MARAGQPRRTRGCNLCARRDGRRGGKIRARNRIKICNPKTTASLEPGEAIGWGLLRRPGADGASANSTTRFERPCADRAPPRRGLQQPVRPPGVHRGAPPPRRLTRRRPRDPGGPGNGRPGSSPGHGHGPGVPSKFALERAGWSDVVNLAARQGSLTTQAVRSRGRCPARALRERSGTDDRRSSWRRCRPPTPR